MAIFIRYLLAIFLFISGVLCLVRFLLMGWEWLFLGLSLSGFLMAYWLLPKQRRQQRQTRRQQADSHWDFDILEILVELPIELMFKIILLPLRFLKHIVHVLDGI